MMPYIPEELQTKITLMAYGLSPHPLATLIKESKTFYCERCVSLARLDFFDFLDDVPYKYIKFKNLQTYHNDVIVRFLPKPEGVSEKKEACNSCSKNNNCVMCGKQISQYKDICKNCQIKKRKY